jgi:hypothetical protein
MISTEEAKDAALTLYNFCAQQKNCNTCGLWKNNHCSVNYPNDDFISDDQGGET